MNAIFKRAESLPAWQQHESMVAARQTVREAEDAQQKALRALDKCQAAKLAADRDLDSALSEREVDRAERDAQAAAKSLADAQASLDRLRRMKLRAEKALAMVESEAKKSAAGTYERIYREWVAAFAAAAEQLADAGASSASVA